MVIYTKLTEVEISKFGDKYSLGIISNFLPLKGGSTNSSYLICSELGKHILTICDDKPRKHIQTLVELLQHLELNKFQTSKIMRTASGSFLLEFKNKPVYLKSYFDGVVPKKLSPMEFEHLGKEIASLHMIRAFDSIPEAFPYGLNYFSDVTTSGYSHPYIEWLSYKAKYIQDHIPTNLPHGIVHGDIFLDNLVIIPDGRILILDFEEVSLSPFIFDIGMGLVGSCSDKSTIAFANARSLITGYQQSRKLSQIEKNSVKLFAIYAATATSFWRFRQYHLRVPNTNKFQKHQEMVDIADSLFQMDNAMFMDAVGL